MVNHLENCMMIPQKIKNRTTIDEESTPVSLPGKSYVQKSLVGCSPWGHKESGMTERLTLTYLLKKKS